MTGRRSVVAKDGEIDYRGAYRNIWGIFKKILLIALAGVAHLVGASSHTIKKEFTYIF